MPLDHLQQLITRLFPRLQTLYQPENLSDSTEAMTRQERRVCSPDLFDIYFRLSLSSGYIPETEMEALLALASDPDAFSAALARLNHDEKIEKFLDLLDDPKRIRAIPREQVACVINSLMDDADLFPR